MKLLLIEDDPTLRQQLQDSLQDEGYVIDAADNGLDGHYLGDQHTFDAVTSDCLRSTV